jgi:hypothetical protein
VLSPKRKGVKKEKGSKRKEKKEKGSVNGIAIYLQ